MVIISAGVRENLAGDKKFRLETQDIETFLEQRGVPETAIVQDPESLDIHESAENILKLLEERNLQDQPVLLVTSAVNMARTYLTFKKVGIEVIPKPTDFYSFATDNEELTPKFQPISLLPSSESLGITTKVLEDFFGTIYYFLRGWLSLDFGFYFG